MSKLTKLLAIAIAIVFLASPVVALEMDNFSRHNQPLQNMPLKVACVGDSITQESQYPSDLQSLLGSNYTVGNFGSSGSTVILDTWKPYMDQPEFKEAENFDPNIVVIMLGTNDDHSWAWPYNGTFEEDYCKLIASFQQLSSKPQIWVVESPPIFNNSAGLPPSYFSNTIIPQTEDVANKLNLPIIDVYDAFGNHSDYLKDGVHPTNEGAAVIASKVYDSISSSNDSSQSQ